MIMIRSSAICTLSCRHCSSQLLLSTRFNVPRASFDFTCFLSLIQAGQYYIWFLSSGSPTFSQPNASRLKLLVMVQIQYIWIKHANDGNILEARHIRVNKANPTMPNFANRCSFVSNLISWVCFGNIIRVGQGWHRDTRFWLLNISSL